MQEENFADKWNMEPAKANEFFCWLQCAKNEIITEPLNAQGVHILTGNLETCFGKNIVQRSIKDEGEAIKTARENKSLYVSGLKGGLQTSSTNAAKKQGDTHSLANKYFKKSPFSLLQQKVALCSVYKDAKCYIDKKKNNFFGLDK